MSKHLGAKSLILPGKESMQQWLKPCRRSISGFLPNVGTEREVKPDGLTKVVSYLTCGVGLVRTGDVVRCMFAYRTSSKHWTIHTAQPLNH